MPPICQFIFALKYIINSLRSNIDSTITWQYNKEPLESYELKDKRQRGPLENDKQKKEEVTFVISID